MSSKGHGLFKVQGLRGKYFSSASMCMSVFTRIRTRDDAVKMFEKYPQIHNDAPEDFRNFLYFQCVLPDDVDLLEATVASLRIYAEHIITIKHLVTSCSSCPECLVFVANKWIPSVLDLQMETVAQYPIEVAQQVRRYLPDFCVINENLADPETLEYIRSCGVLVNYIPEKRVVPDSVLAMPKLVPCC